MEQTEVEMTVLKRLTQERNRIWEQVRAAKKRLQNVRKWTAKMQVERNKEQERLCRIQRGYEEQQAAYEREIKRAQGPYNKKTPSNRRNE